MVLTKQYCRECSSENIKRHTTYVVNDGEERTIYRCQECDSYFSETKNTPLAGLKTPVSRIKVVLDAVNEGLGINAACRTFQVGKNSIKRWLERLGGLKETLLLYALCHQFIQQGIEGDELSTKIRQNKEPMASERWTVVLMDRASRFIWELKCGQRERDLFEQAMETLA